MDPPTAAKALPSTNATREPPGGTRAASGESCLRAKGGPRNRPEKLGWKRNIMYTVLQTLIVTMLLLLIMLIIIKSNILINLYPSLNYIIIIIILITK